MSPPRRRQQHRLHQIHREISAGRFPNIASLTQDIECSEKTIRRDLQHLRKELGAPIQYDPHRRGYFYSDPTFQLPSIHISEGELLGLFLGWQLLRPYRGTDLGENLATLFAKLIEFLPNHIEVNLGDLNRSYAVTDSAAEDIDSKTLAKLLRAVNGRQSVEMAYYSAHRDSANQRTVDPYGFHLVDGVCYLVAFCHTRQEVLTFHPARVLELKVLNKTFTKPADFDLTKYVDEGFRSMRGSGSPQQVTLRFSPAVARYVNHKTWHPTQTMERQPDQSVLLRFTVNHMLEVKRLALSFGPDCEILEPASLREEVAQDIKRMGIIYSEKMY